MITLQDKVRTVLGHMNMKKVAEHGNISYETVMNFRKGRKAYLTEEELAIVVRTIQELTDLTNQLVKEGR